PHTAARAHAVRGGAREAPGAGSPAAHRHELVERDRRAARPDPHGEGDGEEEEEAAEAHGEAKRLYHDRHDPFMDRAGRLPPRSTPPCPLAQPARGGAVRRGMATVSGLGRPYRGLGGGAGGVCGAGGAPIVDYRASTFRLTMLPAVS